MTILEMNIYNTLQAIEEGNALASIEPSHTLVVRDRLLDKVKERIGMEVTPTELYNALQCLYIEGKIEMGDTINDTYAKIIFQHI